MRSFTKILFLSAFLTFSGAACSKKSNTAEPVTPSGATGGSAEGTAGESCPAGGQPQAEGVACGAIYKACCFPDAAAACAAAGCAEQCVQAESLPVQVSCPDTGAEPAPAPTTPTPN
jgi:hypothetical protein